MLLWRMYGGVCIMVCSSEVCPVVRCRHQEQAVPARNGYRCVCCDCCDNYIYDCCEDGIVCFAVNAGSGGLMWPAS